MSSTCCNWHGLLVITLGEDNILPKLSKQLPRHCALELAYWQLVGQVTTRPEVYNTPLEHLALAPRSVTPAAINDCNEHAGFLRPRLPDIGDTSHNETVFIETGSQLPPIFSGRKRVSIRV